MQGKGGVLSNIPPLPQCMDRVIQYKLQFIFTETLEGHPCIDDIPLSYGMFFLNNFLEYFLEGQKPMYIIIFTYNIYIRAHVSHCRQEEVPDGYNPDISKVVKRYSSRGNKARQHESGRNGL